MAKPIFEKKNILVVGGAGFIGSHLCEELLRTAKVICLDNLLTSSESNIDHLLQDPNFEFVKHDIAEPISLMNKEEGLEKFKVTWQGVQEIYYLASPTAHGDVIKYPTETLRANSIGVVNMLELARQNEARFLFVSSDAVYGQPLDGSQTVAESAKGWIDHIGDKSPYAEGKIFGETLTVNYQRAYNLETRIARVFNTYGPKMRLEDTRLIVEMIRQALDNQPINIYGGEKAMSSYCYVTDVVKALIRLMEQGNEQPMNIGHDATTPMVDLAKMIIDLTGSASTLNIISDYPEPYRQPLLPDISVAKDKLGWFPITLPEEGLKNTVEYLRASKDLIGVNRPLAI
jgi:nucleoside-diphosphate-sugar epimerase